MNRPISQDSCLRETPGARRRGSRAAGLVLGPLAIAAPWALAAERFPPPDFGTGHQLPVPAFPIPRAAWLGWLDLGVLLGLLAVATWLAHRKRSRVGLLWLSLAALLYLGFYRKGCVCPVGAIQNVTAAFCDHAYALPLTVTLVFMLPLLAALHFGRVFCAGVCPLGAVQDLVLWRPWRVPEGLARGLTLLPWLYLGLALLCVATGAGFVICQYDPFVGFFRRSGALSMLLVGGGLLLLATSVGRPYCRFLCPYGVLLGVAARLARRQVRVTPDTCIRCGLCAEACPFGAIRMPAVELRRRASPSLLGLAGIVAVSAALGAGAGWLAGPGLARLHPDVALALRVEAEARIALPQASLATRTFRTTGGSINELTSRAQQQVSRFQRGSLLLGAGFLGLAGLRIARLLRSQRRDDYEADPAECVACGRCFRFCPRERVRLGEVGADQPGLAG